MKLTDTQSSKREGLKDWPFSFYEALDFLRIIFFVTDCATLFETVCPSRRIYKKLLLWDFNSIAKSTLCFYLIHTKKFRQKANQSQVDSNDWLYFFPLILNKKISNDVLQILNLYYFCSQTDKINGALYYLRIHKTSFSLLPLSQKSLENLFDFLEIDKFSQAFLIKQLFQDKTFDQLADFLTIYDSVLNKDLIFTNLLITTTTKFDKNSTIFKKIQNKVERFVENLDEYFYSIQEEAGTFEIFNLFDSSELEKSRTSNMNFFPFYKNLLVILLLDSKSSQTKLNSIEIFKLFEIFLSSVKDKSILLAPLTFEENGALQKFSVYFFEARKKELKNLCETEANQYGISSLTYIIGVVSFYIGVILTISLVCSGLSKSDRSKYFRNKVSLFQSVSFQDVVYYKENDTNITIEPTEEKSIVIVAEKPELKDDTRKKFVRSSNGSFASILPRMARPRPASQGSQSTSLTQQVLQTSNRSDTIFTPDKVFKQNRVTPRNTTVSYSSSASNRYSGQAVSLPRFKKTSVSVAEETTAFRVITTADAVNAVRSDLEKKIP